MDKEIITKMKLEDLVICLKMLEVEVSQARCLAVSALKSVADQENHATEQER